MFFRRREKPVVCWEADLNEAHAWHIEDFKDHIESAQKIYEARIEDLKEAHAEERRALNKVIESLAEQVEYLRATMGRPHISGRVPATPGLATSLPPEPGRTLHMSEEEEDLLALHENDLITDVELENLRAQLHEELGPGVLIS